MGAGNFAQSQCIATIVSLMKYTSSNSSTAWLFTNTIGRGSGFPDNKRVQLKTF
jgi:hypothetical protein